jgi:hypothetical protein
MGRILPVHEAHICWPMHHRALILPPLTKKHPSSRHFRPSGTLRGSRHLGRSPAVRIPSPPAPAPSPPPLPPAPAAATPSPAPVAAPSPVPAAAAAPAAAATSTDEGRRGRLRAKSQVAEAGFWAPVAGFPSPHRSRPSLQVFFDRHRHLTSDFKASGRLDLQLRLSDALRTPWKLWSLPSTMQCKQLKARASSGSSGQRAARKALGIRSEDRIPVLTWGCVPFSGIFPRSPSTVCPVRSMSRFSASV